MAAETRFNWLLVTPPPAIGRHYSPSIPWKTLARYKSVLPLSGIDPTTICRLTTKSMRQLRVFLNQLPIWLYPIYIIQPLLLIIITIIITTIVFNIIIIYKLTLICMVSWKKWSTIQCGYMRCGTHMSVLQTLAHKNSNNKIRQTWNKEVRREERIYGQRYCGHEKKYQRPNCSPDLPSSRGRYSQEQWMKYKRT